jgi:ribokinase
VLIGEVLAARDSVARAVVEFEGFTSVNLATTKEVDDAVLRGADLIVVNESEAAWYGDRLALREGFVATTFGASGAALIQGGEEVARVSSPRVDAVDTTGAGDAFTAALTLALVEGRLLAEALRFACAAGAAATQRSGAQPSLPTRDEVQRLLQDTETR